MIRLTACLILLVAVACAPREPKYITSYTEASVSVWGRSVACAYCEGSPASDQELTVMAQEHCDRVGRYARRKYETWDQFGRSLHFDCVERSGEYN